MVCPIPRLWAPLACRLGLSPTQARQLWKSISASPDAKVKAWTYHVWRFDASIETGQCDAARLSTFLAGTWAPAALVQVFETLHAEGHLSRSVASRIQEHVLVLTNQYGAWKTTPHTTG